MKTSKTSAAAAIISFTLVGATSAFALGTGAITPSAPAPTPAADVVGVADVQTAPAIAAPATTAPMAEVIDTVAPAASVVVPTPAKVPAVMPAETQISVDRKTAEPNTMEPKVSEKMDSHKSESAQHESKSAQDNGGQGEGPADAVTSTLG